ncbi:MAG: hypothetical protein PVG75_13990 [Thioalkalispiraceae bacterium]|jgi:hypothetical protein
MKYLYVLLIGFLLLGCATPEERAAKIALKNDISKAAPNVKLILPGSANWCEAETRCEYLRDLKCGTATDDICKEHFQTDTVKLGGDTVVIQSFQEYYGIRARRYSYAQAYRCTGKFNDIGQRYQAINPTRLPKIKYLNGEYAKRCGSTQDCTRVGPFECKNTDWYPARRCLRVLAEKYNDPARVNTLVFEEERFTESDDNGRYQKGDYVVRGSAYQCSTK